MKEGIVTLLDYFATDLALSTNKAFSTEKPLKFESSEFAINVAVQKSTVAEGSGRRWQVALDVGHQPAPETNFPYSYRVALVGQFSIAPHIKPEDEERIVRIHGASVLYGMTREIVRVLTGRGPFRPIIIPTVSFYEPKSAVPTTPEPTAEPKTAAEAVTATPKPRRKPAGKKA
ncbi:protein-export chaperone SecB [Opitutus terrae]|uniref:Preprotein translocase subunit SecB n=1 Tax=Opitutus terrae (strain DSM 11246 / JCM 15787 / PB90-1) TaxID=452637 RepID=B1ZSG4_OPITP|nr:protein-export chaperone SecB [Opitutus terrae]ACB73821.1 hypothetical protein Oter_0531 [Opitutus terrae PB90-1]